MIVPSRWNPVASYITGWINFLGNAAGDATFAASWAAFISASVEANGGAPLDTPSQVGLSIAVLLVWTLLNCFDVDSVGWVNNVAAFVQVTTVVILIVGLLTVSKELNTSEFVFTYYYNSSGWKSASYVSSVGLLTAMFSFSGYEASAHMAEETHGSRTAAPYGIIFTCFATGLVGMGYLLALLYVTTDIAAVLNGESGLAIVDVFIIAGGKAFGSSMAWLIVLNLFFAGTVQERLLTAQAIISALMKYLFMLLLYSLMIRGQQLHGHRSHHLRVNARRGLPVLGLLGENQPDHQGSHPLPGVRVHN